MNYHVSKNDGVHIFNWKAYILLDLQCYKVENTISNTPPISNTFVVMSLNPITETHLKVYEYLRRKLRQIWVKSGSVLGNARLVLDKVGLDLGKYRHIVGLLVCVY